MRIAALAFAVLAGLVASLILALGGLDASALHGVDLRQMSLIRFGLFVVANIGIFGAGIVLAAPLAGAIVLVAGAIGWVVASLLLHHGPDYVMLTPPGLLLVAAVLAGVAHIRRPPKFDDDSFNQAAATQRAAMADTSDDEEEESAALPVGASFFGDAGTATPLRGAMASEPSRNFRDEPRDSRDTWEPVRRRVEPPRQKSMFRSPEDEYDDEESGFSRVARLTSSVLSFGLYAALAGAAVLIVWNLRAETGHPSATKIEASASISSTPTNPSSVPASTQVAQAPALVASQAAAPTLTVPTAPVLSPSSAGPAAPSATGDQLPKDRGLPLVTEPIAQTTPSLTPPQPDATTATPSAEPSIEPAGDDLAGTGATSGPIMPFPMTPQMAAARAPKTPAAQTTPPPATTQAKPRPTPAPRNDTGL